MYEPSGHEDQDSGLCSPQCSDILADNMKIRCDAAPAGMAKAALLHSVIKLHHKNMLWLVAPRIRYSPGLCTEVLEQREDSKTNQVGRPENEEP